MEEDRTLMLVVHGRVQGVGYRAFVKSVAERIGGISGRVKNSIDGSVHILVKGRKSSIDAMLEEIKIDTRTGVAVFHIEINEKDPESAYGKKIENLFLIDR